MKEPQREEAGAVGDAYDQHPAAMHHDLRVPHLRLDQTAITRSQTPDGDPACAILVTHGEV
jgi:hypothetical protein